MADSDMISRPNNPFADDVASMYAPFKAYVTQVAPLILEHVWASGMQKKSDYREVLMNNAWLGRLVTLDRRVLDRVRQEEIAEWPRLRDDLIRSMKACARKEHVPGMIADCMGVLMPVLERRFRENYYFEKKSFHCWWFTVHDDETHLAIHLINAYQPESPFDHLEHFTTTMLQAVEYAVRTHPSIKVVSCGSWLNQFPGFQKLWPESFKHAQKILNETGGFGPGAWGQYMTADGGFNERNADILRNTMKHPFALTEGRCPVEEVRLHLRNLLTKSILK